MVARSAQAPITERHRGRYKIFLGMAAGVGKTYRMLQEGQAEAEAARDVVIGYLEPHDRPETIAQADGLEVIPRRRVRYRDTELEEMDLPAVLRRAPQLCLIDELAHTNAPGLEHAKRYQDIEDVLATGIDVFSTVNVQHLESLNDQIAEVTGTRVRETVPDAVLGTADDVVLLDITPESLIERLIAGKIYPQDRVQAALNNFFTIENLAALREVSLRQVAEEVEHKRVVIEPVVGSRQERLIESAAAQAIHDRLLALVTPTTKSQRVVRRAWRSAQRLGGELDLLWVSDHAPDEAEREQLDAIRRLASVLGAHLLIEHGDDIAATAARVAEDRGTTYILMGRPKPRSALRRLLQPALPFRLLSLLPGVDIRIVADRSRLGASGTEPREKP
ncbi:MAG TPA: histidine kinase [Solirubrobacteraceae bacterium]|jgi:two-component system sensor histidine kinase KdpD|nr:histidine kinase [Solirubrobacteraceae bacterium]